MTSSAVHSSPASKERNLTTLNGVRCLACMAVVLMHVHFFNGGVFFPSTEWCMQNIHNIPIAGVLLFNVSAHMTFFWIISGFLCEYQLTKLQESSNGSIRYGRFLLNRLLRLYPLYLVVALAVYSEVRRVQQVPQCSTETFWKSLVFIAPLFDASACIAMGWSLSVDVHGYLAIVLLFFLLPNRRKLRKTIWFLVYLTSLGLMAREYYTVDEASREHLLKYGLTGSQHLSERKRFMTDLTGLNPQQYFPNADYTSSKALVLQQQYESLIRLYHTSIHKHGSAMLLGSFLFMDLRDRQWKAQFPLLKTIGAFGLLYVTHARFCFAGISVYLLLDVLLTLEPTGLCGRAVLSFLSCPLWTAMAPYSYGIYLTHLLPMVHRSSRRAHRLIWNQIKKGRDPCEGYNLQFILREFVKVFFFAWAVAVFLHWTIEWPFNYIRRRWIKNENLASSKTNVS